MTQEQYWTVAAAISGFAIIVAIYGVLERRIAAKHAARLHVSGICDELSKLLIEQEDEVASASDASKGPGFNSVRNARREVLCSTADELVRRFRIKLSAGECKALATAMRNSGTWDDSLKYWKLAVKRSKEGSVEEAYNLRGLARALLGMGELAEAQAYFDQAIAAVPTDRDDAIAARAEIHAAWADGLRAVGDDGFEEHRMEALDLVRQIRSAPDRERFDRLVCLRLGQPPSTDDGGDYEQGRTRNS
jgi:tetratricopeptide (TPR) repeat protein